MDSSKQHRFVSVAAMCLYHGQAPTFGETAMIAGVASKDPALDNSNLWKFQRSDTQRRRQQQRDQASHGEESDTDPRILSNGAASTSQPSRGWEEWGEEHGNLSQHPSWAAEDEKAPARQRRVPQTVRRQSIDATPVRTAPRRQGSPPPEEDDIWNYPITIGREPDRDTPASGRIAEGGGRGSMGSKQPGSSPFPSNRSAGSRAW